MDSLIKKRILSLLSLIICFIIIFIFLDHTTEKYKNYILISIILLEFITLYLINKNSIDDFIGSNKCSDTIKNYDIKVELCDLNKHKIKNSISLDIHPDKNPGCTDDAKRFFQDATNFCNDYKINNSNNNSNSNSTKNNNYNSNINYSNLSDYDLKQYANSGNQDALRELARRQPMKNVYTTEQNNNDFCSIM